MDIHFDNQAVIVTGAARGIGRASAERLLAEGAKVVIADVDSDRLNETAKAIGSPGKVLALVTDVSKKDQVEALIAAAVREFGRVDIMVNNAGGTEGFALVHEMTDEAWLDALDFNLNAVFWGTRRALRYMLERGWGRIINVTSQQAERAFGNSGGYGASKAGLTGLTRSQSEAWAGSGVCCNAITPGFVATPLTRAVASDPVRSAALAARTMIGRNGEPADFEGVAVFLASRASDYVTGQAIRVDGGFSVT